MSILYLDHFGLAVDPFKITPDADFFFSGGQRGDILEGLVIAAMHDEGILSVVGEIGTGKTMLSRMLLERLRSLPADTVYLANPVFDRDEILSAIARDLIPEPPRGNRAHMLAVLESVLIERYSQGRRVVVVIDEAHSMPGPTLEEIRLLSNLETAQNKLLKIVLFGQPELDELLAAPQLRQVRDRISHRFELLPLNAQDASAYLTFRLHKAAWKGGALLDAAALRLLVQSSQGRTRKLNMLADKSLLAAYAQGVSKVGVAQVRHAVADGLYSSRRLGWSPGHAQNGASVWSRKSVFLGFGLLLALGAGYVVGIGRVTRSAEPAAEFLQQLPTVSAVSAPLAAEKGIEEVAVVAGVHSVATRAVKDLSQGAVVGTQEIVATAAKRFAAPVDLKMDAVGAEPVSKLDDKSLGFHAPPTNALITDAGGADVAE